jgi:glutamine synthetase
MSQDKVNPKITFASLLEAICSLTLDEKRQLQALLDEEIFQAEADLLDQDPTVQAEVETALQEYKAGDYIPLEEVPEEVQS